MEAALAQLERELTQRYSGLGGDIEARCRGYVEFAGSQCLARVESLAAELQELGRRILRERTEECQNETTQLTNTVATQEEKRLMREGEREQEELTRQYEARGKELEKEVVREFEERGREVEVRVRREYEMRGEVPLMMVFSHTECCQENLRSGGSGGSWSSGARSRGRR